MCTETKNSEMIFSLKLNVILLLPSIIGRCNPNFVDKDGDDCQSYANKKYCTINGGYGQKWSATEVFEDYAVNGEDATTCPQCGCQGNTIIMGVIKDNQ